MSVPSRVAILVDGEALRLEALRRYRVLDTPPEPEFDRITSLAVRLFSTAEARIVFMDEDRVWTKSRSGRALPPDLDTLHWKALYAPDVTLLIESAPGVPFFAGASLRTCDGYPIGVLSILDSVPYAGFSEDRREALLELAGMVVHLLAERLSALRAHEIEAERERASSELQARLLQQAAVVRLGKLVLEGASLDQLMRESVEVVARTLGVEFCKLLELQPNGRKMVVRAGVGWRNGVVGRRVMSVRSGSQAAYCLKSSEPVIVEDLRTETRFRRARLLTEHGVVSGASVIIHGRQQPFGVIGAHTSGQRKFTIDDVNFLQSVANTLSAAVERRRAVAALGKSEATLRALLDAVPQGIVATNRKQRIVKVNARTMEMFGYTREELVGRAFEMLLPERYRQRPIEQGREICGLRKDGSEFPIEVGLGHVHPSEAAQSIRLITDVTERKRVQEQIGFQASLLAQVRNAVMATDSQGKLIYWNDSARSMYGWSAEEAIGEEAKALIVPAETSEQADGINASLAISGHWEGEVVLCRKDRSRFPAFVTASSLRDPEGQLVGVVGVSSDISERKRTEEALRQAKKNLDQVLQTTPLAIVAIDLQQRVRFWNSAAERMFGWTEREVIGRQIPSIPEQDAEHFGNLMAGYRSGVGASGIERRRKRKDGTLIDVRIYTTPLRDATGEVDGALGVFIDITDQRRFEDQVRQSETLDAVCRLVEAQSEEALCSVLLVDESGLRLRHGGAPSLPKSYVAAIDGVGIGPAVGSCGTAVCTGETVIAADISTDSRWERFRTVALEHGLRACWSAPIFSSTKRVLGAFAMYSREPRHPNAQDLELLERAAGLAASVIERNAAGQALREKEEKYRSLFEESRDAIIVTERDGTVVDANQAALELLGYSRPETERLRVKDLYVDARDSARFLRTVKPHGSVRDFDVRLRCRDGREIECLITATERRARGGGVIGYQAIVRDVTAKREAERSLLELSGRLLQLQDEERRRIARELHDSTAQSLAALAMNISLLEIEMPADLEERPRNLMTEIRALAAQCSRELRTISHLLHPPLLDELGLASALRSYVDGFANRSGLKVDLEVSPDLPRLPRETETALFRIVQESLTNVHRHSGSRTAQVRLLTHGGSVCAEVSDQGRGLPGGALDSSFGSPVCRLGVGLRGMRERVRQLGGSLEVDSGPSGTNIRATLPSVATL